MPGLVAERHTIAGPAGALEALLELSSSTPPRALALICHPHPLHGGTLSNKVVHTLARTFVELGAVALRFNFRGVGASEGDYADGIGEVDDALAAAEWIRSRWPQYPLHLAGFSFGAAVALQAAASISPRGLVTVALPFERIGEATAFPNVPWLSIHGSDDALISPDALAEWLERRAWRPTLDIVAGADHFFHGKLVELRSSIERFCGPLIRGETMGS